MNNIVQKNVQWVGRRRGSALILTMLILLVLSALGMMALRSVSQSVQQSGAYRVRTQADGMSEAAVEYASAQAGNDAKTFWSMMNSAQGNASREAIDADSSLADRKSLTRRGAFLELTQRPGTGTDIETDFEHLDTTDTETGLLGSGSFEAAEDHTQFSVIIRDPLDGPPAPGYGEQYCFKKVTIASRALVGQPDRDWTGSGMMAESRHGMETFIGPIECGAQ